MCISVFVFYPLFISFFLFIYFNYYLFFSFKSKLQVDPLAMNFVPLGEAALRLVVLLYQNTANEETVISSHVLRSTIQVSEGI